MYLIHIPTLDGDTVTHLIMYICRCFSELQSWDLVAAHRIAALDRLTTEEYLSGSGSGTSTGYTVEYWNSAPYWTTDFISQ